MNDVLVTIGYDVFTFVHTRDLGEMQSSIRLKRAVIEGKVWSLTARPVGTDPKARQKPKVYMVASDGHKPAADTESVNTMAMPSPMSPTGLEFIQECIRTTTGYTASFKEWPL